jgi:hypothetical protein
MVSSAAYYVAGIQESCNPGIFPVAAALVPVLHCKEQASPSNPLNTLLWICSARLIFRGKLMLQKHLTPFYIGTLRNVPSCPDNGITCQVR